jgi:regulator of protease activity HflC (stomatin/prohibitin superfamily)
MSDQPEISFDDSAQLTQVQIPLDEAAEAFAHKDVNGQTPIVMVPTHANRIRNEFVLAGLGALVIGILLDILLNQVVWVLIGIPISIALIIFGVYRSFIVRIPEGAVALMTRGGRYQRDLPPGTHILPPWFVLSHLVTSRQIPYDIPAAEMLTMDNVRVTVDGLITFIITNPYKFIYSISASDFDHVLFAVCKEGLRTRVREMTINDVIRLTGIEMEDVRQNLNTRMEDYGVCIVKVNVMDARLPDEFMQSREGRQLAALQQLEQAETQRLAKLRQANQEELARQELNARMKREKEELQLQIYQAELRQKLVEMEAETEKFRLANLEKRLKAYPVAADWEAQVAQLAVARALAGNTRAFLQIGDASDIVRAFMLRNTTSKSEDEGDTLVEKD